MHRLLAGTLACRVVAALIFFSDSASSSFAPAGGAALRQSSVRTRLGRVRVRSPGLIQNSTLSAPVASSPNNVSEKGTYRNSKLGGASKEITWSGIANVTSSAKALPLLRSARHGALEAFNATDQGQTFLRKQNDANSTSQRFNTGVVHYLFLIKDSLPHAALWQAFFAGAPPGTWQVLVHCSDPAGCARSGVSQMNPSFKIIPTTPTWYCHDLVTAMAHLLQAALALNAGASFPGGYEKFVFLSESTLPAKSFRYVQSALMEDNDSDFCLFPANQWGSAMIDSKRVQLIKHHQWVVLNRPHAELFVSAWKPVDARGVWQVWLKGGSWQGNERYVSPQHFYHPPNSNWCTDEWAFFATVFGAVETQGGVRTFPNFGGGIIYVQGPASLVSQGRCRTFSYWDSYDAAAAGLAGSIFSDTYGSRISCYPQCVQRPATLEQLSDTSLGHLQASPFLFARKFVPTSWFPNYQRIVFQ